MSDGGGGEATFGSSGLASVVISRNEMAKNRFAIAMLDHFFGPEESFLVYCNLSWPDHHCYHRATLSTNHGDFDYGWLHLLAFPCIWRET